ncbi:rolling circle replication-associated protein [Candidatus Galacturonibacter soehngenii]|uniref:Replication-associated protein ORF2/G2P domain-containing protein n=1 Tax=Candidatus Galacturonatibacter soehngenii TaxID=2307010 RepID=A0A7V7QKL4_9FIRM|nr:hypothetical protein [Candidatus Galacturonibacter soehngenii]KAB1438073.1 hypothetical protein F7O84_10970 [Candidatus Galacturonibacter soehngenii]
MKIRKVNSNQIILHENTEVKFKIAGNTREVQFSAGVNKKCLIQNISKDKYLDKETGEIKERKKSENRYQSPKSVRKSINKLMDLIRCNATETSSCKWLTLTYADVMIDHTKVYEDGKMFLRRLQQYLNNQTELSVGQKLFKRITVAEPQGESHGNSWHLHILLIFQDIAPFISNDVITELWGHGMTDTHKVYDADGLALYFKVYLSDVEYVEGDETYDVVDKVVDGKSKQFIKGGRLKYYPTGMPLFSASRGMKRPVVEKISNKEAMERVSDCKLVYQETFVIGDKEKKGNLIDKRYYRKN